MCIDDGLSRTQPCCGTVRIEVVDLRRVSFPSINSHSCSKSTYIHVEGVEVSIDRVLIVEGVSVYVRRRLSEVWQIIWRMWQGR